MRNERLINARLRLLRLHLQPCDLVVNPLTLLQGECEDRMTRRTVVTMLRAEPDKNRTIFGIFQATIKTHKNGEQSWNLHRARYIASVECVSSNRTTSYRAMAEPYATSDYPVWERMAR